jgi:hypothetical protein
VLLLVVALGPSLDFPSSPRLGAPLAVIAAFFIATVASAPLWTLVARSMIGGLVFSLAGALLVLLLGGQGAVHWHLGWRMSKVIPDYGNPDSAMALGSVFASLIYSGASLCAARRKFERLELKDPILGESTILSGAAPPRVRGWRWLRIRPSGPLGNLVRKELRLQRPTLVVAGAFCVCWLAAVVLKPSNPEGIYQILWQGLACGYIVLAVALAGSISQGEERALGLAAWHLTLPISARRQWLVKLAVAAAAAIVLGVVLPGVLALATLPEARDTLANLDSGGLLLRALPVGAGLGLFFALAFWASTLLKDTLGAFFMAMLGAGALWLCATLSGALAEHSDGLETGLVRELSAWWQRPAPVDPAPCAFALGAVAVSLAALGQSRRQFRRAQVPTRVIIGSAALLLAIAALAGAWWGDYRVSASAMNEYTAPLQAEVFQAVRALPYTEKQYRSGLSLTASDLEKVYPLSTQTQRWLKGAELIVRSNPTIIRQRPLTTGRSVLVVSIQFPNGYGFEIAQDGGAGCWVFPSHVGQ